MILASSYPYTGNGLGGLPDAIEATVTHEINGEYEFQMRYPVTGMHYEELQSGSIIMAKPDDLTDEQPFRIYRITKPLNGIVTVYARHLCYDLQGIIVEPFSADSLTTAFQTIPTKCTPSSPITLTTTRTVASGMSIAEPRPLWKLLGGQSGSILDVYGGEWNFDKDEAELVTRLGLDRGVTIRYGKNMTSLEQDATIESSYSGVYPYWYDEESNTLVTLTEKYVTVAWSVVTDRVMILDCSGDWDTAPTEQQLRDRANAYITANSVGNVKASWKISFVDIDNLDQVMLGDTLHVYYERLDVNATARAVKTEYDVLQGRYKSITIGKVKQNLASIIVENQQQTEEGFKEIKSDLETAVDDATDFIRNGQGYMRFIYNSSNELVEIVSLDNPDITQASSVWRWNNGGFGHSSTGYNGAYTLAITQNGAIVADFITAGTLNANVIRAGILQDTLGKNSWNLATGALTITDGMITATYTDPKIFYRSDYDPDPDPTTNQDMIDLRAIILRGAPYSQEELDKYDFDGNGELRNSDLIKLRNMIYADKDYVVSRTAVIDPRLETVVKVWNTQLRDEPMNKTEQTADAYSSFYSYYDGDGNHITNKTRLEGMGLYVYSNDTRRTDLTESGLLFFDANGAQSASYPATGLGANNLNGSGYNLYSSTGTTTVALETDHTYLVTCMRRNSAQTGDDAAWLVSSHTNNSNIIALKSSSTTTATVTGLTLTINRGTAYSRVTWTRLA